MDYRTNINFKSVEARRSFTLLETIVAIYVLLSGIVGMMTLASENLKALSYFRDQLIAANLAQEGAELVRNRRDSNFIVCQKRSIALCSAPGPNFDFNQNNMDGLVGPPPVCDHVNGCRVVLPLTTTEVPEFVKCTDAGSNPCQFLKQDADGIYNSYNSSGKYHRKITLEKLTNYHRGSLPDELYDWHLKVRVEWKDRLVPRWVEINDVLTPNLHF